MSNATVRGVFGALALLLGIFGCRSAEETNRMNREKSVDTAGILSQAPVSLSPSTAHVELRIIERTEDRFWSVEIREVLGYGSSTPMLTPGSTLRVDLSGFLSNVEGAGDSLSRQDRWQWIIQHRDLPKGTDNPAWMLTDVVETH